MGFGPATPTMCILRAMSPALGVRQRSYIINFCSELDSGQQQRSPYPRPFSLATGLPAYKPLTRTSEHLQQCSSATQGWETITSCPARVLLPQLFKAASTTTIIFVTRTQVELVPNHRLGAEQAPEPLTTPGVVQPLCWLPFTIP